jgi:excisionase family DNA binding protein
MNNQKLERLAWREAEIPQLTGIAESTVAALIKSGAIPSVKLGGSRLISASVLERLLTPGGDSTEQAS